MANNFDAFIRKCEQAPKALADARIDMVRASALAVTTAVRSSLQVAAPSGRLSGVGKAGAKLSVGFTVAGGVNTTALVAARGPWQLIERDTKAHRIGARARRGRTGRPRLAIGGVIRTGPFDHPGTHGKHPFEKGVKVGEQLVPGIVSRSTHRSLAKVFTG